MTQSSAVAEALTFEEYAERWANDGWLSTYFNERYWEGGLDTFECYEMLLEMAKDDGIKITDAETVDFDRLLFEWYRDTEKGLS